VRARARVQAHAVVMPDHRVTFPAFGPVAAGAVFAFGERGAVRLGSRQDVVLVRARRIVDAREDAVTLLGECRLAVDVASQVQFLDAAGQLWQRGALVGKVGSVFTSSNTQHGGQESTILSVHTTLLHLGMVVVGLPYSFEGQTRMDEITGCSPYGASTIAGADGRRQPSENELEGARFQGRHVALLAARLAAAG